MLLITAFLWCLFFRCTPAIQAENISTDSLSYELDEIIIQGNESGSQRLRNNGDIEISGSKLAIGAKVMGESDFINTLKTHGGINSIGDYGAGLSIDGGDVSHSFVLIDDSPLIFPYRFGGLFSVFNSNHFPKATFTRYPDFSGYASRLGSVISIKSPEIENTRTGGDLNLGLLASSLTLRYSDRKRFTIVGSARISYVNQIYRKLLKISTTQIGYDFEDVNLTASYNIDSKNSMTMNLFFNNDELSTFDSNYALNMKLQWNNGMASIVWKRIGKLNSKATLYFSAFRNKMDLNFPQMHIGIPNSLLLTGCRWNGEKRRLFNDRGDVEFGINFEYNAVTPQYAEVISEFSNTNPIKEVSHLIISQAFADLNLRCTSWLTMKTGLSIQYFRNMSGYNYIAPDPSLTLIASSKAGQFTLNCKSRSQFIHLVGFSEIGMASNFWLATSDSFKPQRSAELSLSWQKHFPLGLTGEAAIYCKNIRNQPEYSGIIFEMLQSDYDYKNNVSNAFGYNAGFHVGIRKDFGKIGGSMSYSYGIARRHFEGEDLWWNSVTSSGNSFNIGINWSINRKWNLNATFVYADGRPYTPIKSLFIVAENLMAEYGVRNSARLPNYQRLDLNGSFTISTGGKIPIRHIINIGIINAYGHNNVEMQYYNIKEKNGNMVFYLKRVASLYRFLPSVSYSASF